VIVGELLISQIIFKELYGKASLRAPRTLFGATEWHWPRFQWAVLHDMFGLSDGTTATSLTF
jgi:hypothetical protein